MADKFKKLQAQRAANEAANREILRGAAKVGQEVGAPALSPAKVSVPQKRKPKTPSEPAPKRVTRSSRRLNDPESADPLVKEEQVPAELKSQQSKRTRTNADLALTDIKVEGKWNNNDNLASFSQGAQPGVPTFFKDQIKNTSDKQLKDLVDEFGSMKLYEGWHPKDIKITQERIYSLTFHPREDKPYVFAGDKKGVLGWFDASQKTPDYPDDDEDEDYKVPPPEIGAVHLHGSTLSSIAIPAFDSNSVLTGSYDSSIRCLDLEKGGSHQVWQPENNDEDMGITCIEVSPETKDVVYFSTLVGQVGRVDRRMKSKADMWGLTENDHKIGGFSLSPMAPHLLAAASLERTLKIWDLRMIKGKGEMRRPYLVGEHRSPLSVSHASWSPGGHIATSSYDNTVKIYDMSDARKWKPGHDLSDKEMEPSHTVRHNCQTGRWVTILKPKWQANPSDGVNKLAIASMNRFVDVYDSKGEQLAQLSGGDAITAVPAVAELHPTRNIVAAGNGSGKLTLWM